MERNNRKYLGGFIMNIGIIVHSHTGNTLSVAEKLKESLTLKGHIVTLERVIAVDGSPKASNIQLKAIPIVEDYDYLFFGAPVWAFSLSSVMKLYLTQLTSLKGKKIGCFVTQRFPYSWMGGSRAVNQMIKLCDQKGAMTSKIGVINWSSNKRSNKIDTVIENAINLL